MAELQVIEQFDLSGGEDTSMSPYLLAKTNKNQQVVNMVLTEHGSLKTRDGTQLWTQSSNTVKTNQFVAKVFIWVKFVAGATTFNPIVVLGDGSVYNATTTPWTALSGGNPLIPNFYGYAPASASGNQGDVLTFVNKVMFTGSTYNGPGFTWDGTTFSAISDGHSISDCAPNGGLHMAVYAGQLYLMNTAGQTGTYSNGPGTVYVGPSSVQGSAVNNPSSWPIVYQYYIGNPPGSSVGTTAGGADDNQQITGAGQFTVAETGISPEQSLVIFKEFSTYQQFGNFGANSLAIQKVKTDMGSMGKGTIQFINGVGLIRLTHKGFAVFDGLNDSVISESERPRIFGLNGFAGINFGKAAYFQSAQIDNPPTYICACSQNGDSGNVNLSIVFMYDVVRQAWTVHNFANPLSSLNMIKYPGVIPFILGGDYVGIASGLYAQVRRMFNSSTSSRDYDSTTDDGVAINWSAVLRPNYTPTPVDRAYYRRALLLVNAPGTPTPITAQLFYGASSTTVVKTPPTRTQDSVIPCDLGVTANNVYPAISGTGPITIRGYEVHLRAKPLTRSTVQVGDL